MSYNRLGDNMKFSNKHEIKDTSKGILALILTLTLRNFIKLPVLRYFGICNDIVLCIWSVWAIPTFIS